MANVGVCSHIGHLMVMVSPRDWWGRQDKVERPRRDLYLGSIEKLFSSTEINNQ